MVSTLTRAAAGLLALGVAVLWLRGGGGGAPPAIEDAPTSPAPLAALAAPAVAPRPPAEASAAPAPAAESNNRTTARVRVTVLLPNGAYTAALPVPELHRLGPGRPPVARDARPEPSLRSLATQPAVERWGAAAEASCTFEVERPGRYAAAWHLCRSRDRARGVSGAASGPDIAVAKNEDERVVVVHVGSDDLGSDPALDRRAPGAQYRFTPKDGD